MTAPDHALVDRYRPRLAQVFHVALPPLETEMERTVGEALILPDPAELAAARVPAGDTAAARADTTTWLRRLLRPEWQDEREDLDLAGMRDALFGKDALFGDWSAPGLFLEVIATAERVHLRTRLAKPSLQANDTEKAALAVAEAHRLCPLGDPASCTWTPPRRLGPLVFTVRDVAFARGWGDTCLLVTDGAGVKLSFLKLLHRTSPPKHGGPPAEPPPPWFPRPPA